jgi:hypothetical protein
MKTLKKALAIAAFVAALFCGGCMVIKTDHAFIYTFMKNVDTETLALVADPNSTKIGSGQTKTSNDSIKASAIVGGMPVIIETDKKGN